MKKYFFLISIFSIIYIIIAKYNYADWDLWARLAVGAVFFKTGQVLKHDIFAYTPTKPLWVDHEWGSGVVFYGLSHFFGDYGLLFLKFFIILFIFVFIFNNNQFRSEKEDTPYNIFYYAFVLVALIPGFSNTIRSQSFTYLFFAMWLYLLELVKRGKRFVIYLFPLTMLLWANLHGGFVAGLGVVALYGLGEAINKRPFVNYIWIFIMSSLVTLINPYGIKYWTYLFQAVTMSRPYVSEWQPLHFIVNMRQVYGFEIIMGLTIISFIYLLIKRFKKINIAEVLILAGTLYMSCSHIRHIIFFVIAAASYIYYYLYSAVRFFTFDIYSKFCKLFPEKFRYITLVLKDTFVYGLIILVGMIMFDFVPLKLKVNPDQFPTKAVEFIKINHLDGNLMVLFNWGSYALWKLYPHNLVAVDGRYEEVYTDDLIQEVARFHYAWAGWDELITKYKADILLIPREYDVYDKVLMSPDWKIVYHDKVAAIFVPIRMKNKNWKQVPKSFDAEKEKFQTDISL